MKEYKFKINGKEYNVAINSVEGNVADVTVNGTAYMVELENSVQPQAPVQTPAAAAAATAAPVQTPVKQEAPAVSSKASSANGEKVASPLPGVIIEVSVKVGDVVKAGEQIAVLEAMKMENTIEASTAGTITAVHVNKGDSVLEGAPIVTIA